HEHPIFVRERFWSGEDGSKLCTAQIRGIAYTAPQNSDVDFGTKFAGCTGGWGNWAGESNLAGRQRIDRVRRQYNQWVANQTLEDYALRFTAKSARRWSAARGPNTALGAISFLALEAIGGTITLNYGVTNATAAILVVSVIIFFFCVPIASYGAKW